MSLSYLRKKRPRSSTAHRPPFGGFINPSRPWGSSQVPAPQQRTTAWEEFRSIVDVINQRLARAFSSSPEDTRRQSSGERMVPPAPAPARPPVVMVIDDDDEEESTCVDRSYSEQLARRKSLADRCLRPHGPDDSVLDRVEAMETEAAMEIADTEMSTDEQIARRLEDIDSARLEPAVRFLASSRNSDSAVVIEKYNIPMTERNLKCLTHLTWLNDEVINFYMSMLQEKDTLMCAKNPNRIPSHYFNSFFVGKLLEGGRYNYKNVKRYAQAAILIFYLI